MRLVFSLIPILLGLGLIIFLSAAIADGVRRASNVLFGIIARLTAAFLLSLGLGIGFGTLAGYISDFEPLIAGGVTTVLSFPLMILLTRSPGGDTRTTCLEAVDTVEPRAFDRSAQKAFNADTGPPPLEKALHEAFVQVGVLANGAPNRVAAARNSVAAFLHEIKAGSASSEALDNAGMMQRQIPELVKACEERCRHATMAERALYIGQMLESLEALGAESDRLRIEIRGAGLSRFDLIRAHIASRLRRDDPWKIDT